MGKRQAKADMSLSEYVESLSAESMTGNWKTGKWMNIHGTLRSKTGGNWYLATMIETAGKDKPDKYKVKLVEARTRNDLWQKDYDEEPDFETVVADLQAWQA